MVNSSELKDEIVISGISGRFPESSNVEDFRNNLFNGVNMVNDDPRRWPIGLYGMPNYIGKIKQEDLENCDIQFFGVSQNQAEQMDPTLRMLLELTYEAIIDAGINPQDLRGSRTGVYIGACKSEAEQFYMKDVDADSTSGYILMGCILSMIANRISFTFDFRGPSYAVDTACSSSLFAMHNAYRDIKAGLCDAAIVAGASLILRAKASLQFWKLSMSSPDGACKVFDETANGYARSDGCVAIFLQKAKNSRRVYSTILNIRTNTDGAKEKGPTFPNIEMHKRLYEETYKEINLNPLDVVYIEAHGTGTKVGDPVEANGICDYFCKDRQTPLLIGSVKSNMGHSETASAVCSIAKMLIAMEEGIIPGNLHFKNPNPNVQGLMDGRLKVVDKNTPWDGGIIGLTSFGFGGVNVHAILKSNDKQKNLKYNDRLPRLAVVSGRSVEAVEILLLDIETHKEDKEYLALLNRIHSKNIPRHNFRGYTVVDKDEHIRDVVKLSGTERPIWFVYSGMGSQWSCMAKELMQVEVFSKSIYRCAEALRPEGIDLIHVVTQMDLSKFDILTSFIAITAVQVGLTDVLKHLSITPDGIVGHSFGEIACAYADGCFTVEQAVLASYWRGRSILDTDLINGMMAAVDLTWEECLNCLPEDIFPACHNSAKNVTISGPKESVKKYVETLHNKNIFARTVNVWDRAYHSKYINDAVPKFKKSLEKIITNPKERSYRWVSSSILENEWNTSLAKDSSAAYHANNFRSPVYFHAALQHIPENAICIEIAPHGILRGLLKQCLPKSVTHMSLAKRNCDNNIQFLLSNIGKLYTAGAQPDINKLYRPVSFPVGRGTPMLNSKIRWDHSLKWTVPYYGSESTAKESIVNFNLNSKKDSFLVGHTIDGRVFFPATGYIVLAWRQFLKTLTNINDHIPVILEDVVIHHATIFPADGIVKFNINFLDVVGKFTICMDGNLVVSGNIRVPENIIKEELHLDVPPESKGIPLNTDDFYKEFRLRGYDYSGLFRGVIELDSNGATGKILWTKDNWITFMDTALQAGLIGTTMDMTSRKLFVPTRIEKIIINPDKHFQMAEEYCNKRPLVVNGSKEHHIIFPVYVYKDINVVISGGIEIYGVEVSQIENRHNIQNTPVLERDTFVPNDNTTELSENIQTAKVQAIMNAVLLVAENCMRAIKLNTAELILCKYPETFISTTVQRLLETEPRMGCNATIVTSTITPELQQLVSGNIRVVEQDIMKGSIEPGCHLYIAADIFTHPNAEVILNNLIKSLKGNGFILLEESFNSYTLNKPLFKKLNVNVISRQVCSNREFILLRPIFKVVPQDIQVVHVTEKNFEWLENLKLALKTTGEKENKLVYIVCQGEKMFGAMGFMKCLKIETNGQYARLLFIQDTTASAFSFSNPFYMNQLTKDLTINVLQNGVWGTFRHLTINCEENTPIQVENAYVNIQTKGNLSTLNWVEGPPMSNYPELNDPVIELCTVYYAPLNFRDIMVASGKLTTSSKDYNARDCALGLEFSGRDSKGNRIMGVVPSNAFATKCIVPKNSLWRFPDSWTLEQASTVPIVYSTVYYALVMRGKMKKGETILIHSGSGGVGQAAIRVALAAGLTVLTTVGSKEKREFLRKTFPQLKDHHIGNSRDCSFKNMVMRETKGKGVDLVLNSLADEKLQASLKCLGFSGRFLEIGKFNARNNSPMGMSVFSKNTSFHGITLDDIFMDERTFIEIAQLLNDSIKSGVVQPLPTTVFEKYQVEQAFRFMASGKHIGKVVIKLREEEEQKVTIPKKKFVSAIPRTYMRMDKTYVIIGGLGGFGLEITGWLISKGARNIVLGSRSGIKTGYQSMMVRRWESSGVKVVVPKIDVTTREGAQEILQEANEMGPVGGVFNLATVFQHDAFQDESEASFRRVCLAKVNATKFLDEASRTLCPDLDYFICFSSAASGRGIGGMTSYAYANSAMERICEARQDDRYPGIAIQWGAIGDTGLMIDKVGDNNFVVGGIMPQRMVSCLETMDFFIHQPYPVLSSFMATKKRRVNTSEMSLDVFILNILGFKDITNISQTMTLLELGIDSIMTIEVKHSLERNYDIVMNEYEIKQLTMAKLQALDTKTLTRMDDEVAALNKMLENL